MDPFDNIGLMKMPKLIYQMEINSMCFMEMAKIEIPEICSYLGITVAMPCDIILAYHCHH